MCGAGWVAKGPFRHRIRRAPCSTSMAVPLGQTSISFAMKSVSLAATSHPPPASQPASQREQAEKQASNPRGSTSVGSEVAAEPAACRDPAELCDIGVGGTVQWPKRGFHPLPWPRALSATIACIAWDLHAIFARAITQSRMYALLSRKRTVGRHLKRRCDIAENRHRHLLRKLTKIPFRLKFPCLTPVLSLSGETISAENDFVFKRERFSPILGTHLEWFASVSQDIRAGRVDACLIKPLDLGETATDATTDAIIL